MNYAACSQVIQPVYLHEGSAPLLFLTFHANHFFKKQKLHINGVQAPAHGTRFAHLFRVHKAGWIREPKFHCHHSSYPSRESIDEYLLQMPLQSKESYKRLDMGYTRHIISVEILKML